MSRTIWRSKSARLPEEEKKRSNGQRLMIKRQKNGAKKVLRPFQEIDPALPTDTRSTRSEHKPATKTGFLSQLKVRVEEGTGYGPKFGGCIRRVECEMT